MGKKKKIKRISGIGWFRSKLRKYRWGAVALGACTGGMKMIASHGMIGIEDIIFPIIGMITGGAVTHITANIVDDVLEDKQEMLREAIIHKEVKQLSAEVSREDKPVAGKAGSFHTTL